MKEIVEKIKEELKDFIVGIDLIEEKEPFFEEFKFKNNILNEFLKNIDIKLYKHQKDALELLYNGKNTVVTTSTASGKSLIFRLYIIDNLLSYPNKTFLLIYPLRALLYDQLEKLEELIKNFENFYNKKINANIKIFLGDLKSKDKEKMIKERPNIILTTTDNLHLYLLKNHEKINYFLKNLDLIVVDELHSYKGIFGTNSSYVFRRLIRLLKYYYKNNYFKILALSATLSNPKEFAEKMFGEKFELINNDYSRRYKRYLIAIDPGSTNSRILLKKIIRILLENNIKSLVFIESRKGVELSKLYLDDLPNKDKIYTYKATYSREVRREIENKFKNGDYTILLTTSALELGIDIGDVKCVVNYGIPYDGISSILQRFGRSGRTSEGLNIIIFKKDSLDFFYSSNIKLFFDKIKKGKIEDVPLNLNNEKIVKNHLIYLIKEFGRLDISLLSDYERKILEKIEDIKINKDPFFGKYFASYEKPVIYTGLRNISDDIYYLLEDIDENMIKRIKKRDTAIKIVNIMKSEGKIIEEMDNNGFFEYLLPGMVYYSRGKILRIKDYYKVENIGFVFSSIEYYFTETLPIVTEDVDIIEYYKNKKYGDFDIYYGKIKVVKEYLGYIEKYKVGENVYQNINYYDKTIKNEFITKSIWITIPEDYYEIEKEHYNIFRSKLEKYINRKNYKIDINNIINFVSTINKEYIYEKYRGLTTKFIKDTINDFLKKYYNIEDKKLVFLLKKLVDSSTSFREGLHAIEHNIIKVSPIVTHIDSKELGGYSYPKHPMTGKPTIFIYEGFENGVGLSEILFEKIEELIKYSINILRSCKCLDGCPKCILSPKCGNYNEFLDKYAGRLIYRRFLKSIK